MSLSLSLSLTLSFSLSLYPLSLPSSLPRIPHSELPTVTLPWSVLVARSVRTSCALPTVTVLVVLPCSLYVRQFSSSEKPSAVQQAICRVPERDESCTTALRYICICLHRAAALSRFTPESGRHVSIFTSNLTGKFIENLFQRNPVLRVDGCEPQSWGGIVAEGGPRNRIARP